MRLLTAAEIGAFLGMSSSGVRQIVRRNNIPARGKVGKAKLYDPLEVIRHAGAHDRMTTQPEPACVTLGASDRMP